MVTRKRTVKKAPVSSTDATQSKSHARKPQNQSTNIGDEETDLTIESGDVKIHVHMSPSKHHAGEDVAGEEVEAGGSHDSSGGLSSVEARALLEDFIIESASRLHALKTSGAATLASAKRQWHSVVAGLDDQIRDMSMSDFIEIYNYDNTAALQAVTANRMQPAPMGLVEQSGRKRKRPGNPSTERQQASDDEAQGDEDVFGTTKRPRVPVPASASKQAGTSAARGTGRNRGAATGATPTAAPRQTRNNAHSSNEASSSHNFIYRTASSLALNPALPPTPSVGTTKRNPRRGESIVMLSVNNSPLGIYVAPDDLEASEPSDGDGEWDVMERNEASRVEEQGGKKGKGKGKGKVIAKPAPVVRRSSRARSSSLTGTGGKAFAPPASAFTYELPAGAPDYEEMLATQAKALKEEMVRRMREALDGTAMSAVERARLEERFVEMDM